MQCEERGHGNTRGELSDCSYDVSKRAKTIYRGMAKSERQAAKQIGEELDVEPTIIRNQIRYYRSQSGLINPKPKMQ